MVAAERLPLDANFRRLGCMLGRLSALTICTILLTGVLTPVEIWAGPVMYHQYMLKILPLAEQPAEQQTAAEQAQKPKKAIAALAPPRTHRSTPPNLSSDGFRLVADKDIVTPKSQAGRKGITHAVMRSAY